MRARNNRLQVTLLSGNRVQLRAGRLVVTGPQSLAGSGTGGAV